MSIFATIAPAFKEIGRLRKGAPKSQGLKDLKTFRIDIRPDEPEALSRFLDAYGTSTPGAVNVRLAFNEIDRVWSNFFTVYNKAGMLGKAGLLPGLEGWYWHYLRSQTGELLVKDGRTKDGGAMRFDPSEPVYSYRSGKGKDVAVYAKPEGRLHVMIPELRIAGYVTFLTHGWYDCMKIESQLQAIKEMAERVGMSLPMVPLILSRRPEQVSVSINGQKHMEERWIVNLDVRQDWGEAQFALLDKIQPGAMLPAPAAMLALPAQIIGEDDEPEEELEEQTVPTDEQIFSDADKRIAESQPKLLKAQPPASNGRPYSPQQVAAKIQEIIAKADEKQWKLSDGACKMLPVNLEKCFAGDPASSDKRHSILFWLIGKESTNDLTDSEAYAVSKWLNSQPLNDGSGDWMPDAMSAKEAQAIYTEAMRAEGQQELF